MSVKVMGQVWEKDLPFNKAWVLMAMADHADHEGNNVHPALDLVAWKTGYSERQVGRIVADLRDDGILIPYGHTPFGVVIYRIELKHIPDKAPLVKKAPHRPKGSRETLPRKRVGQIDTPFSVIHNHQLLHSNREEVVSNSYLHVSSSNYYTPNTNQFDNSVFDDDDV